MNRLQRVQVAKEHWWAEAADAIEGAYGDTAADTAEALGVTAEDVVAGAEDVMRQCRTMSMGRRRGSRR